jgi:hypothetical protein
VSARARCGAIALLTALSGTARAAPVELTPAEIYASYGVMGLTFSDKARSAVGRSVRMIGYVAPPLKAGVRFFVLTRTPVAICPFCSSDADWPVDIVVVYPQGESRLPHGAEPVAVTGLLELGSKTDATTGFVSQVRIVDASLDKVTR